MRRTKCLLRVTLGPPGAHSEASLFSMSGHPDAAFLSDVYTAPSLRNQGLARVAINALLEYADRVGLKVYTYAQAHGPGPKPDDGRLWSFYRSFGFIATDITVSNSEAEWMLRWPVRKQTSKQPSWRGQRMSTASRPLNSISAEVGQTELF